MLQARGIGVGLLLTLLVLVFLIALCSVLLIPHLLGRGAGRLLGVITGRRASAGAPSRFSPARLLRSLRG